MSNPANCLALWKRGWEDIANNMNKDYLYCLFAHKPDSSWHGGWGACEDFPGHHYFERHISYEQLNVKLNELYRIEARLQVSEVGFTKLAVFEHDPLLQYDTSKGQPQFRHYRELLATELHNLTEPIRLKAIADVEAERVAAEAKEAIEEATRLRRYKEEQYELLKKELGL